MNEAMRGYMSNVIRTPLVGQVRDDSMLKMLEKVKAHEFSDLHNVPDGERNWRGERTRREVLDFAQMIVFADPSLAPAMCEVWNDELRHRNPELFLEMKWEAEVLLDWTRGWPERHFEQIVERHDLTYQFSDDHRYFQAGASSFSRIQQFKEICIKNGWFTEKFAIDTWNAAVDKKIKSDYAYQFKWATK